MPGRTAPPPFPAGIPEVSMPRVSLSGLLRGDAAEVEALCSACQAQGFFYLDLQGCDAGARLLDESEALHELSRHAFALPREDKDAVAVSRTRSVFGFKTAGITNASDPHKRKDRGEMWNVAKDDALSNPGAPGVAYPAVLQSSMPLFRSFSRDAHSTGLLVLGLLARHLGIPPDELTGRHRIDATSGDHTRLTWGPGAAAPSALMNNEADTPITTYAHTDFGSFTLLFNWLGGLQIQLPDGAEQGAAPAGSGHGEERWGWVRPVAGHAICNLGDAMVIFAGGRVRSGRHRVIGAPGEQALLDRYSIVYFVRPEDDVYLEDLTPRSGGAGGDDADAPSTAGEKRWKAKEWIEAKARGMGNKLSQD